MKKLFLVLAVMLGISGCEVYTGEVNTPYHHYSCEDFCDDTGCRNVCGNHYYDRNGVVYYWDAGAHVWIGHPHWHTYRRDGYDHREYYRHHHNELHERHR